MEEIFAMLLALTAPEPDGTYFANRLAQGDGAPVEVTPCLGPLATPEIVGETIICGIVTVPEDHDDPDNGRTIDLAFAILRAETTYPAADPLVYLHGGPGIGNLDHGLSFMAEAFAPFRAARDVVIFDQRAAGISSDSVSCYGEITANIADVATEGAVPLEEDEAGNPVISQFLPDCLAEIASNGTDLSAYNTTQNALDVPTVLTALGYDEWNLYGISYGTKLTLETMRVAPEGIRSVVIDGVAPQWVRLYDLLALPLAESMERLVRDCAAEPACDAAYPDLGDVLTDVITRSTDGEILLDGEQLPPQAVLSFFAERNNRHHLGSLTPYIPAMIYELARGQDTPTVEMVIEDWRWSVPPLDAEAVIAARGGDLTEQQAQLLRLALGDAEIIGNATDALDIAVADLRRQLHRDRELGPMPGLFDTELSAALPDTITTSDAARAALTDYAGLRLGEPTRDRLSDFVRTHFNGPHLSRLLAIVDAMTEDEIAAVYEYSATTVRSRTLDFQENWIDLTLYACQEDVPYNTFEGYQKAAAEQPYDVSSLFDEAAMGIFTICEAFEHVDREDWHEVVESDIPTVSIGSGWDTQTAASWAKEATRGLTNAQHFFIAEAGHGALAYADCVGDMTVAFINNPTRELDDSCVAATAVPPFYIAPWVEETDAN
ncbi:TAP-like protein [Palleronia aestuarii]|uniref:Proline iminopeptidase n=1 Tax=Palleronia aestuarii TaxID=568105 RepID=A0A2W7N0J8_9RHOB|nr:alpha/beta fold hydrolase [Palleronia aestuarii]PZX13648.1 TAP-like protein [Palleronia aestuarii]